MEISDILASIDIVEYLSQFCEFEERGGELWSLSPFKEENTPSFSLRAERGYWYDFSAGFGGNLIDFVMRHQNVNLGVAVKKLKEYANITEDVDFKSLKMSASHVARRYKHNVKPVQKSNGSHLPNNTMEKYEFRVDKLKLWESEGITLDSMKKFGVRYDGLSDRIVFPIKSYDGDIISVCGRTCDQNYKEKKLRKYTYFQSVGTIDTLYGFSDNRESIIKEREIILFEGAKSVLLAYGWGIYNTSAILTSHLSTNQFRFLVSLGNFHGIRIVFALDADVDIREDKNIMRLSKYTTVEWVRDVNQVLDTKDSPVDKGLDIYRSLYNERRRV